MVNLQVAGWVEQHQIIDGVAAAARAPYFMMAMPPGIWREHFVAAWAASLLALPKGAYASLGIVNLFARMQHQGEGEASHLFLPSGGQSRSRDLLPDLKSAPHLLPIRGRGKPMSVWAEVLGDGTISGEEPLGLTRGFEPLHPPLPLACRLVRVLRAVIEIAVLTMFYPWEDLALGSSIALEFVSDDHPRYVGQSLKEFAQELLRRFLIPPPLDQDIQDVALLIDRPPELMPLALDH